MSTYLAADWVVYGCYHLPLLLKMAAAKIYGIYAYKKFTFAGVQL
jgi:hypothetical protein